MSEREKIIEAIKVSAWLNSEDSEDEKACGLIDTFKMAGYAIVPVEPTEGQVTNEQLENKLNRCIANLVRHIGTLEDRIKRLEFEIKRLKTAQESSDD